LLTPKKKSILKSNMNRSNTKNDLTSIPGVGDKIALKLNNVGIHNVSELKNRNPEKLYNKLTILENKHIDRCVLYVFRCAVYFASKESHDPELLKWWNWKDK